MDQVNHVLDLFVVALTALRDNWPTVLLALGSFVGVCSQIAPLTPWGWDDAAAGVLARIFAILAGNWGNATSRPVPPAEVKSSESGRVSVSASLLLVFAAAFALFTLLVVLPGCAHVPGPTARVVSYERTLAMLENRTADYAATPFADRAVVLRAKHAAVIAYDAVKAAKAADERGESPDFAAVDSALLALAAELPKPAPQEE